jgi:Flp pilus assembly protein TadG
MMRSLRHLRRGPRSETGSTIVEFALVAPIVFLLLFGIIAGCFLAYQNSALHDGASAGSRMASIETSLVAQPTSGPYSNEYCESDSPSSIESAVAGAAPLLTVNPARLCSADTSNPSPTELTQSPQVNGDVNITVTCTPTCAAPTTVSVALAFSTKGLVAPFGFTYNMSATSAVPTESP